MNKINLPILSLCLIILMVSLFSCVNSMDDLYEDYNSNYSSESESATINIPEEQVLNPNDEGFDQINLLYDEYFVYDDGTLNLSAPSNCYEYTWILRDPEDSYRKVEILKFWEGSGENQREFIVYMPDSGLESGKTYQLTLTLKNNAGKGFYDTCGIVVYSHLNYATQDEDKPGNADSAG